MIPALLTLTHARTHLRTNSESDDDLMMKVQQASMIVMRHIKLDAIPEEWFSATIPAEGAERGEENYVEAENGFLSPPENQFVLVPFDVEAAIALQSAELFEMRDGASTEGITPSVENLLTSRRDPTMA